MADLELDFDKVMDEINGKLKQSAEALQQAIKLAEKLGYDGLIYSQYIRKNAARGQDLTDKEYGLLDDELFKKYNLLKIRDLEVAVNNAGWSTSSSSC